VLSPATKSNFLYLFFFEQQLVGDNTNKGVKSNYSLLISFKKGIGTKIETYFFKVIYFLQR